MQAGSGMGWDVTALSLQAELLCLVSSACPSVFPLACQVIVSMGKVSIDGTADVFSIWLRTKNNCFPQSSTWQCCSARTVVAPCGIQCPQSLASPGLGGLRPPLLTLMYSYLGCSVP